MSRRATPCRGVPGFMTGKQYSGRASVINALHVAIELPSRGQRALKGRRPGGLRGDSWPSRRLTLTG
jgi:hypothetical protein